MAEMSAEEVRAEGVFNDLRQEVTRLAQEGKFEQAQMAAQEYSLGQYGIFQQERGDIFANMAKVIWKFRGLIGDLF